MPLTAVLEPGGDLSTLLYVLAFSLFIIGIKQGTSPTTAKRGNLIAAVGMAIAVVTTATAIPTAAIMLPRLAVVGDVPCLIPMMNSEKART